MSTTEVVQPPRGRTRVWPVAFHAPLVAFLTVSVLLTDDRGQTWTRLSELLLSVAGLPWSFVGTTILAFLPLAVPAVAEWDGMLDAVIIVAAWANVIVLAWLTRRGLMARPLAEGVAMLGAGVGIWAALLSWAPEADYRLLPSAGAAIAVLATAFLLSTRRRPVLVACLVGGGAYVAICAHVALNASLWIFLAVPLAVLGGAAVALAAWAGSRLGHQGPHKASR